MQLYKARDSWIVNSEKQSLWFNRRSLIVYSKPGRFLSRGSIRLFCFID